VLLQALAESGVFNIILIYVKEQFGFTPKDISINLVIGGFATTLSQAFLIRPLVLWFGERKVLLLALVSQFLACVSYGISHENWHVYATSGLLLPLSLLALTAANGVLSSLVAATEQGVVMGGLAAFRGLTNALGPLVFGGLSGASNGAVYDYPSAPFFFAALLCFLGWITALHLKIDSAASIGNTADYLLAGDKSSSSHVGNGSDVVTGEAVFEREPDASPEHSQQHESIDLGHDYSYNSTDATEEPSSDLPSPTGGGDMVSDNENEPT